MSQIKYILLKYDVGIISNLKIVFRESIIFRVTRKMYGIILYTLRFTGKKDKAIPVQSWRSPEGSRSLRLPDF
jgi:hypothetical protein